MGKSCDHQDKSCDSDSYLQSGLYPLPPGVLLTSKLGGGEIFPDQSLVHGGGTTLAWQP